jgi:Zn-dependent peptidase ImmA (M78 family)/transcriptional regulator with XRE-family HTH domain
MVDLDNVVAAFDPLRLRLARQLARMTKAEIAKRHGFNSSLLTQYERGTTRPSTANVAKLALALGVDAAYFMKERPLPTPGTAHFRSLRSSSKAERDRAVAEAFVLWDAITVMERHLQLPPVSFPQISLDEDSSIDDVESAAHAVRDAWDVPDGPVANVVRLLESHGAVVARLHFETRRLDAFSIELGDRPFVLLGDDKGDAARSRLDAAHELAHLVAHDDAEAGDGNVERQAHQFAAAFLMPADQIASELPARFDISRFIDLKHQWGVSIAALLYRARELSVMSDSVYRRAVTYMSSSGYRVHEPAPLFQHEAPVLLGRCLIALADVGITVEDIATELHLPPEIVVRLLDTTDERPRVTIDGGPS